MKSGSDLGLHVIEVDGVTYKLKVLHAMGVLDAAAWAMRCFGGPVAQAVSTSDGLGRILVRLGNKDSVEAIMGLDTSKPGEFFATLNEHLDLSSLIEMIGEAVRIAGERLTYREIRNAFDWAVKDLLFVKASTQNGYVLVDDETTFNKLMDEHMKAHGAAHVLKLFWAIFRAHTGPTSAGSPG